MADALGEELAIVLLRVLPPESLEAVLGKLGKEAGERIRALLQTASAAPPSTERLNAALEQFFDLNRIASRPADAGTYSPVAPPSGPRPAVEDLRTLSPQHVARVLESEQPGTIALVLSRLEPAFVGQVLRKLPLQLKEDIAVRLTRPQTQPTALIESVARVVVEKARRLELLPPEPTQEDQIEALTDILRTLPRLDRNPILNRIESSDAEIANAIREKLYRIEDLLRIPDRQLQQLLAELDVKKLTIALKGTEPAIRTKVMNNMSTRAKEVLNEESELLGEVSATTIRDVRKEVLAVVRRLEDEGKITIEE